MTSMRVLTVSGAPYEMGYTHGQAYAKEIGELTEERLRLSCDPFWTGGQKATLDEVLALGRTCLRYHDAFAPDLMEEMRGTLAEVKRAAQSLRVLTDYLERHPEALIRGKSEELQ